MNAVVYVATSKWNAVNLRVRTYVKWNAVVYVVTSNHSPEVINFRVRAYFNHSPEVIIFRLRAYFNWVAVLLFFLIFWGWAEPVWGETEWNVHFFTGYNSASLKTLNDEKLNETSVIPPVLGGSPSIQGGPLVGVEVEWRVRPRFSLVAFVSSWEGESRALESGEAPFQDNGIIPFSADRITRLTFNEYALRGRYHILDSPKRHRLYLEIGFFDQVQVTYREDYSYLFQATAGDTLRNISSRAVGKGGYLFEWGLGGDIYLNKWAAFSLNANYRQGKAVPIYYKSFRHTFTEQDAIAGADGRGSPFPVTGEKVLLDGNRDRPLMLELDGWQASAGIRIFF